MSNDGTSPRNSRYSPELVHARGILAIGVGLLILFGAFAGKYHEHLRWKYQTRRLGLQNVPSIPNSPMQEAAVPDEWTSWHVGALEFSLPPDLVKTTDVPPTKDTLIVFESDTQIIAVSAPTQRLEFAVLLNAASTLHPNRSKLTIPRLRLACYGHASGDFRWSMNSDEVRWHAYCITTSKLIRSGAEGHTESFFRDDIEGVVHYVGGRALLDWQCPGCDFGGYMHIIDPSGDGGTTLIRRVCNSISVSCPHCDKAAATSARPVQH